MLGKRKITETESVGASTPKRTRFDDDAASAAPFPVGPGGPMEIVFSFDTTGSMSSCLVQVRKNLTDMINRLQKDIPGLRMAVFAHGDYCDAHNYVTKYVDFTNDVTKLVNFVNNVKSTGGGDADECYELVLYEVRTKLSWSPGTQRSLVMIGDANPHEPDYPQNKLKLDWRNEIDSLSSQGVRIYGVNCGNSYCEDFYKKLASKTDGKYLELKDWNNIFDMMMGICYREHGADFFKAYEHEVRSRGTGVISCEMDAMLKTLRRGGDDDSDSGTGSATPTNDSDAETGTTPASAPATRTGKTTSKKRTSLKKRRSTSRSRKTPSAKTMSKSRRSAPNRRLREKMIKLPHMSLEWSRWQRLITKTKPNNRLAKYWIPSRSGSVGFRRVKVFKSDTDKPTFYEVGVKVPDSRRIYAVYSRLTNGFKKSCNIDTAIFNNEHLTSQVNDVITKDCDVYIRRAVLPPKVDIDDRSVSGARQVGSAVRLNLEYAWNKGAYGRRQHRLVMRRGVKISSDKF